MMLKKKELDCSEIDIYPLTPKLLSRMQPRKYQFLLPLLAYDEFYVLSRSDVLAYREINLSIANFTGGCRATFMQAERCRGFCIRKSPSNSRRGCCYR